MISRDEIAKLLNHTTGLSKSLSSEKKIVQLILSLITKAEARGVVLACKKLEKMGCVSPGIPCPENSSWITLTCIQHKVKFLKAKYQKIAEGKA